MEEYQINGRDIGLRAPRPHKHYEQSIEKKVEDANRAAALYATVAGCYPDELETYAHLASQHGPDVAFRAVIHLQEIYRDGGVY